MKEPNKFNKAREQFRILSSPYVISKPYEIWGGGSDKKEESSFWPVSTGYVPRVEYCKFRPREEKI